MAIDKAKWHSGGDFPKDVNPDQSYLHIGLYLGWLVKHNLSSPKFEKNYHAEIEKYRQDKLSHIELCKLIDGVLTNEELNKEGEDFTYFYYDKYYADDYEYLLNTPFWEDDLPTAYHVRDTVKTYRKLEKILDKRLLGWRKKTIKPMTKSEMWYKIIDEVIEFLTTEGYKKIKRNKTSLELHNNNEEWRREISIFNLYSDFRISIRFDLTSHILNTELTKRLNKEFTWNVIGGHPDKIEGLMDTTSIKPQQDEFIVRTEDDLNEFINNFKTFYSKFGKQFFDHFSSFENLNNYLNYNIEQGSVFVNPNFRIMNGLLIADLLNTSDKQQIVERFEKATQNIKMYELIPGSRYFEEICSLLKSVKGENAS